MKLSGGTAYVLARNHSPRISRELSPVQKDKAIQKGTSEVEPQLAETLDIEVVLCEMHSGILPNA